LIYLDTHAVVWLYAGLADKFSAPVRALMNEQDIAISPAVRLELQFLHEIQRVADDADTIVTDLANRIGLTIGNLDFNATISRALEISWTRDPFDRIIVANASLDDSILVSKDQNILSHYPFARW
jgi:PIN domain nuclease of toxin-antitoxin system